MADEDDAFILPNEKCRFKLPAMAFDIDFHPCRDLVTAALISGATHLIDYTTEGGAHCLWRKKGHSESCRAVRFSPTGDLLVTGSSDLSLSLRDTETGARVAVVQEAHSAAVNRLAFCSPTVLASGDDEGVMKLWDFRESNKSARSIATITASSTGGYITDILPVTRSATSHRQPQQHEQQQQQQRQQASSIPNRLLVACGDGSLAVVDLAGRKLLSKSDSTDDDFLSVVAVKNGSKYVCGSQSGTSYFLSASSPEKDNDRFTGHPDAVSSMIALNDTSIFTASADGKIRLMGVFPHRIRGVVGWHTKASIEALALNSECTTLCSTASDHLLKFWDVSSITGRGGQQQGGAIEGNNNNSDALASNGVEAETRRDEADSDDSDSDEGGRGKKRRKKVNNKKRQPHNAAFFADMD